MIGRELYLLRERLTIWPRPDRKARARRCSALAMLVASPRRMMKRRILTIGLLGSCSRLLEFETPLMVGPERSTAIVESREASRRARLADHEDL